MVLPQTKLRVFEAFSGYGSQTMALKRYKVPHENIGTSEIDEYAILAACAVHCEGDVEYPTIPEMLNYLLSRNIGLNFKTLKTPWETILESFYKQGTLSNNSWERVKNIYRACVLTKNFGDISRIDATSLPDHDLFTYSFPCTSISFSGLREGLQKGSGTKSSLLWECEKLIEAKKPKYLMMENVKALVSSKFKDDYFEWLSVLESLGYVNYWKVVNAKHCGVPQNRERVFCVSILKEYDTFGFHFYDDFDSDIRLSDLLEDSVDEKYYFDETKTKSLLESLKDDFVLDSLKTLERVPFSTVNESYTFKKACAVRGRNPTSRVSGLNTVQRLEVSKHSDISNCLTTVQKDSLVLENKLIFVGGIGTKDRIGDGKSLSSDVPSGNKVYSSRGTAVTQTSDGGGLSGCTGAYLCESRIRTLTNRESFRFMAVSDEDIDKIQSTGISSRQQYKLAGNSIVVGCMEFLKQLV